MDDPRQAGHAGDLPEDLDVISVEAKHLVPPRSGNGEEIAGPTSEVEYSAGGPLLQSELDGPGDSDAQTDVEVQVFSSDQAIGVHPSGASLDELIGLDRLGQFPGSCDFESRPR